MLLRSHVIAPLAERPNHHWACSTELHADSTALSGEAKKYPSVRRKASSCVEILVVSRLADFFAMAGFECVVLFLYWVSLVSTRAIFLHRLIPRHPAMPVLLR